MSEAPTRRAEAAEPRRERRGRARGVLHCLWLSLGDVGGGRVGRHDLVVAGAGLPGMPRAC